jgi:hypothetical protein
VTGEQARSGEESGPPAPSRPSEERGRTGGPARSGGDDPANADSETRGQGDSKTDTGTR